VAADPEKAELYRWYHESLRLLGVTLERYEAERDRLSRAWGRRAAHRDVAWTIWNQLIVESASNMQRLFQVQRAFARVMKDAGSDDWREMLRSGMQTQLLHFQQRLPGRALRVMTAGEKSCAQCRGLEGKAVDPAAPPLPVTQCAHGFCRCLYAAAPLP